MSPLETQVLRISGPLVTDNLNGGKVESKHVKDRFPCVNNSSTLQNTLTNALLYLNFYKSV